MREVRIEEGQQVTAGEILATLDPIEGLTDDSKGDYVMTRPLIGPLNSSTVDHSTDAWDTIDWLVKHVPESNGRVGMLGSSYEGFTVVMALVHPHPALKVTAPMSPMVDGWMGDDWFHYGAFRQQGMPYIFEQEATRKNDEKYWRGHYDDYDMFLAAGSAGDLGKLHGLEQVGQMGTLVNK